MLKLIKSMINLKRFLKINKFREESKQKLINFSFRHKEQIKIIVSAKKTEWFFEVKTGTKI